MSATVDANVLVYASNASEPTHGTARALVERLARGPELVYLFWPTVMGYLRLVTHPAILPAPLTPSEATLNIDSLLSRPHVRSPGEATGFWDAYRATSRDRARGNDVPDAHLVALMVQHGVTTIYTRDRDFRQFEGITAKAPFA